MSVVSPSAVGSNWDDVMFQLARWLTRHLDDPALVWWLSSQGGRLSPHFAWLIKAQLEKVARLEVEGKTAELAALRAAAPKAVPGPLMRKVWGLLLSGVVKPRGHNTDLFTWRQGFKRDGLSAPLRSELRDLLAPRVELQKPHRWDGTESAEHEITLKRLVEWNLVLASDHVSSLLKDLTDSEQWRAAAPDLLVDFERLLRDALDLLHELGEADDRNDRTHWDIPSISNHWQNRRFRDWTSLVELLRDAWLVLLETNLARARLVAEAWMLHPYPTFKRLAFFAATHEGIAPEGAWVKWVLSDDAWWLWSSGTLRETMRLLVLRGTSAEEPLRTELETHILIGPPRPVYRSDLTEEEWSDIVDHSIWLRLAKLNAGGATLGPAARSRLHLISQAHPEWQLAPNEQDEFSHWTSGTGDPDWEDHRQHEKAPRTRRALVAWLQQPPPTSPWHEDDWLDVCRSSFPAAATALSALAATGKWPDERWRTALQAWSEEKFAQRSWKYLGPVVARMPEASLLSIAASASWWLESVAKGLRQHVTLYVALCDRFLRLPHAETLETEQPVTRAINHPIGHVTQGLLHLWFGRKPEDRQQLPADLAPIFTALCDRSIARFRHGRVLLASNAIALYRVDPDWSTRTLLPFFSWEASADEARAVWAGFLWSPRLYRPLYLALKTDFLATANHYEQLGDHGEQYAAILTFASLDPGDSFASGELRLATAALPAAGLQECAAALVRALEGAGEKREEYWRNRVRFYLKNIWPQSITRRTRSISINFARLCIAARAAFPDALEAIEGWLQPAEHGDFVVHLLKNTNLPSSFPAETLKLLDLVVPDDAQWLSSDLNECLERIRAANPGLAARNAYIRLSNLVRRRT